MTIKELTKKLSVEFKEFRKDYDDDYPAEDISDEFSMDYFGDEKQANLFLDSLNVLEFIQLLKGMVEFYDDPIVVLPWVTDDNQELANEIIGFIIRNYVI